MPFKLTTFLETLLSQAEDPQERIRALVTELRGKQVAGRRALGLTIAFEKRLLDELVVAEDLALAAEAASKDALARGDASAAEEQARALLDLQARRAAAQARWAEQRAVADRVQQAVGVAARRTEEVAHAHTLLLARAHCADAAKAISDTLALLEAPEIKVHLARAELKVEAKEAAR